MELLDNALTRIEPYITEALEAGNPTDRDFSYRSKEDYGYFGSGPNTATIARLRLDWELADTLVAEIDNKTIAGMMLSQMGSDLEELILDGDVTNYSDPLLKSIDGSRKRGKDPKNIDIFNAQLFWEHKARKKPSEYTRHVLMYEYTLYLLMAVQWED